MRAPIRDLPALREPSLLVLRAELATLWRTGRRRWWLALLAAAVVAGGVAVQVGKRTPRPHAKAVVRLWEAFPDDEIATRRFSRAELTSYVNDVVLSASNLVDMYRRKLHDGPEDGPIDELGVVSDLREFTRTELLADRVVSLFGGDDRRRAALVELTFEAREARVAERVARALAELLVERGAAARERSNALVMEVAARNFAAADRAFHVAQLDAESRLDAPAAGLLAQRDTGFEDGALALAQLRVARARAFREAAERRVREQDENPFVKLEIVSVRAFEPWPRRRTLAVTWLVAFVLGLPLSVLVTGAFSGRLADEWDVRRAGAPWLGTVALSHARGRERAGV